MQKNVSQRRKQAMASTDFLMERNKHFRFFCLLSSTIILYFFLVNTRIYMGFTQNLVSIPHVRSERCNAKQTQSLIRESCTPQLDFDSATSLGVTCGHVRISTTLFSSCFPTKTCSPELLSWSLEVSRSQCEVTPMFFSFYVCSGGFSPFV